MAKKVEFELNDAEVMTLTASIATCILMGLESHMPKKSALASRISKVEDAIRSLAQLNGCKVEPDIMDIGVLAWGDCMKSLEKQLKARAKNAAKKEA